MNPESLEKAEKLALDIENGIKNTQNVEVVICPPFVYFSELRTQNLRLKVGAQNCHFENKGAYTGEISPSMLKNLGIDYVILGHSERRQHFGETDSLISKKIKAVINVELTPILCLGETSEQRKNGQTENIIKKQLEICLSQASYSKLRTPNLIVAYEPVWAIGTGNVCKPEGALKIIKMVRDWIFNKFSKEIGDKVRILYGGSVDSKNVSGFLDKKGIDGFLVGGASLDSGEFLEIIKKVKD